MFGYDAARWHAVLNDLPAALLFVAVLFDIAAAVTKRESLMWASIWTLWAGVIGGWAAVVAGKIASNTIEHGEAIHEIMEKHENMALLTMALFTVVLAWRLFRRFQMPAQELAFTRMLSIVGLLGLVWTGVLGGRLWDSWDWSGPACSEAGSCFSTRPAFHPRCSRPRSRIGRKDTSTERWTAPRQTPPRPRHRTLTRRARRHARTNACVMRRAWCVGVRPTARCLHAHHDPSCVCSDA